MNKNSYPKDFYLNIEKAVIAAVMAGEEIMDVYAQDFSSEIKDDGTPITIADKKANDIIIISLKQTELPIISEESRIAGFSEREKWNYYWLIDPIDGTKEFINKNDEFTVNIALMQKGNPVAGVIFAPALKQLYFGIINDSAYYFHYEKNILNNKSFNLDYLVSNSKKLNPESSSDKEFQIAVSRSHFNKQTESFINYLKENNKVELITAGSSLKFCRLSEGKCNLYPRFGKTFEWDIAAGHAILSACGGEVYSLATKKPVVYNKAELENPFFIAFSKKEESHSFFKNFSF